MSVVSHETHETQLYKSSQAKNLMQNYIDVINPYIIEGYSLMISKKVNSILTLTFTPTYGFRLKKETQPALWYHRDACIITTLMLSFALDLQSDKFYDAYLYAVVMDNKFYNLAK